MIRPARPSLREVPLADLSLAIGSQERNLKTVERAHGIDPYTVSGDSPQPRRQER
jgi:hypothetical protein